MKKKDFEIFKKDVACALRQYVRYDYVRRTATVLGKIQYIAHQYPDAVFTAEQVIELFDLVGKD